MGLPDLLLLHDEVLQPRLKIVFDTLDLGVVILVVLQLIQTLKDATHHQQVLILAEQQELQLF